MKPSKEYLQLKAGKKLLGKPFKAKLTKQLAIELLIRADDCRPVNPARATEFAFEYLGKTLAIGKGDPIGINYDSDNLYSGVQRLAGFILSGLKEHEMWFKFESNEVLRPRDRIELPINIQPPYPNRYRK